MKKYIVAMALALFAFNVHAAEIKIGYVDLNKALNESEAGKAAVSKLEEMVQAKQVSINEKGEEIKKLEEELSKQASILTSDAIKAKRDERDKLMRDYQRMVKDSQDEVQKKQSEFMDNIVKDIRVIIEKMGKEQGYTAIFEKAEGGILYYDHTIDLTAIVIKRFNESSK